MSKPKPSRPFQEIAMDFCSFGGQQFLIVVDCFIAPLSVRYLDVIHEG